MTAREPTPTEPRDEGGRTVDPPPKPERDDERVAIETPHEPGDENAQPV